MKLAELVRLAELVSSEGRSSVQRRRCGKCARAKVSLIKIIKVHWFFECLSPPHISGCRTYVIYQTTDDIGAKAS